jgi:hypothetical protein
MRSTIYIEGNRIDLFDDENFEINSSVANTDDISKINSDYTKLFSVPASETNNKIFKHFYNADINNTFDSRTTKKAEIKLDGFSYKKGRIRLEKVVVKNQVPYSYSINFWGELINISELIGNDKLSNLDFSIYNFDFTSSNVKSGLQSYVPSTDENIIYTLFSDKQYVYNILTNENTDTLVNIAYNGNPRGVKFGSLKPSIRLIAIIEAIENKYSIKFSRDFFDTNIFRDLFLWVKKRLKDVNFKPTILPFTTTNDIYMQLTTWVYPFLSISDFRFLSIRVIPEVGYESLPYVLTIKDGSTVLYNINFIGNQVFTSSSFQPIFLNNDFRVYNISFEVTAKEDFQFTSIFTNFKTGGIDLKTSSTVVLSAFSYFDISLNMPDISILDFLKGIFSMFKLVAIPKENEEIYVDTIDSFYRDGNYIDISKYVDFSSYDVNRGVISNVINFKYQEPKTILAKEFLKLTGQAYGDEELKLTDENNKPLDGDSLEITLPFEQPIYERLPNTNIQYGLILDEKLEDVETKPIIFYNNNTNLQGTSISFINNLSVAEAINTTLNIPSQCLGLNSQISSLNWGEEFSTWNNAVIKTTLFSKFWKSYILSVFNIKKRLFSFNAVLPTQILLKLKLNDIFFISERWYRINDYSVNLLTGEAKLNLTNNFEYTFNEFMPSQDSIYTGSNGFITNIKVTNSAIMNISIEDIGFGTSWCTAEKVGVFLRVYLSASPLLVDRDCFILVDNGESQSFKIYVNQKSI